MEVEFVLRPNDVLALHQFCLDRRPHRPPQFSQWLWLLLALLGVALVWFLVSRVDRPDFTMPVLVTVVVGALVILKVFQRSFIRSRLTRLLRRQLDDEWNRKLLGWRRLAITPETITLTSKLTTYAVRWQAVEQIVTTEEHAFFLITRQSGIVLPVRAFTEDEEFGEFVRTARRYRREAVDDSKDDSSGRRRTRVEETGFTAEEPAGD
jgi:hypothetical protein